MLLSVHDKCYVAQRACCLYKKSIWMSNAVYLAMSQISISRSQPQRDFELAIPSPSLAAFRKMGTFETLTSKGGHCACIPIAHSVLVLDENDDPTVFRRGDT